MSGARLAVLAVCVGLVSSPRVVNEPVLPALAATPSVRAALADAETRLDQFVVEWVRIAEIPAPSGGEARRAEYVERRFRELGLSEVARDAAGNVLGLLRGRDASLPRVAMAAHLDTVAQAQADHSVRRTGATGPQGRLIGPGIRDDASGLAGLLAAVSLMRDHGLRPEADTWIVATVEEEIGLKGAERFARERVSELGAFIAVDGHLGQISYAATGILWLKLHFTAEGAHTLKSHEKPSAILAAARAIERISSIPLRRSPETMESWINIGAMRGGDVPNAQARDAWFSVDLRSNDPRTFEELEGRVLEIGRQTASEIGVGFHQETLHRLAGAMPHGAESSRLVRSARGVLEHLGWSQVHVTPRGTADHNVALALGIPGIAIGVTTGDGAHTPAEYADIAPFSTGVRQILLLALQPLTRRD